MKKGAGVKGKSLGKTIANRLNEFADALENGEDIVAKFTCRKMVLQLDPQPYDPERVRQTRDLLRVSQGMFAKFLGVKTSTVQAWEQGKQPNDMACRFMDEIRHNPKYWRQRLLDSMERKAEA